MKMTMHVMSICFLGDNNLSLPSDNICSMTQPIVDAECIYITLPCYTALCHAHISDNLQYCHNVWPGNRIQWAAKAGWLCLGAR